MGSKRDGTRTESETMNIFVARHAKKDLNTSGLRRHTGHERGRRGSAGEGECNRVGRLGERLGAGQSVVDIEPKLDSKGCCAWQEQPLNTGIPVGERIAAKRGRLAVQRELLASFRLEQLGRRTWALQHGVQQPRTGALGLDP